MNGHMNVKFSLICSLSPLTFFTQTDINNEKSPALSHIIANW